METPAKQNHHPYRPEERTQGIERFRSSGLTQVQFAEQNGLKLKTLQRGLYGRRSRRAPKRKPPPATFREIKALPLGIGAPWVAEVTWPSGLTMRLSARAEVAWIGAVLEAVRQAC